MTSPERAAAVNLGKKRWTKAEAILRKAIRKDTANVVARYVLASWYFAKDNPAYHLDSAYAEIVRAIRQYPALPAKEREKIKRFPLDSAILVSLRARIDSAAFLSAKAINTEQSYIDFLAAHPHAANYKDALQLRNEVAFLDALSTNTYEAFYDFLNKYPLASNAADARRKYERLLYESRTSDGRLSSFETFLREYPEVPFRNEVEQHIFELFTLSGEPERLLSFLQLYPTSHQVKKARDILFHLLQEQDDLSRPTLFLTDSLTQMVHLQESYLVPFLKNDRFGFMDKDGAEVIRPTLEHLNDEYKCGNVTEDIIVLPDRLLARDGTLIFRGNVEEIDDLGAGFLKLKVDNCFRILHKSGFLADSCAENGKVLGNRFLALQKQGQWFIHALSRRKLTADGFDEIALYDNVLALRRRGQWHLITRKQFTTAVQGSSLSLTHPYDEIKLLATGKLWVRAKNYQGIVGQELEEIVPFSDHILTPVFFGYTAQSPDGYSLYDHAGNPSSAFDRVLLHDPWTAVFKDGAWHLFDVRARRYASRSYDSLRFEGPFAVGVYGDTLSVHFSSAVVHAFTQPVQPSFLPGKDSTSFLSLDVEGKKTIYTHQGKKLFTLACDQLQYAGMGLFIIIKKEKKGLVNTEGKTILPVEYDAIGSAANNVISLLRSMKFGLYHIGQRKLIKPQYDKNLVPYAGNLITAFRDGAYGFITWDNKPDGKETFDEIRYWNDTIALARKDQHWMFYIPATKAIPISDIRSFTLIRDTPDEKLAIIRQQDFYGVISSKRGKVIPPTFTDLVNVGSEDEPLYFTEKHVEEAEVFVVIYYDRNGRFLRREVYQEPDDYEKIYCPEK